MDTDADCFQLLPDDLVLKILSAVNSPYRVCQNPAPNTSARDLLCAQATCKRFLDLTWGVKKLSWQLGSVAQSISLGRFLQRPEVNLQELTLIMTVKEVTQVPSHVLFTTELIEGLPERVNFHFTGTSANLGPEIPEIDISMLIAYVLISPALEHLSISSEGVALPAVNSMHNRPPSQLRSLRFNNLASIQTEALEHLLVRCSRLESLMVRLGGNANRWPPSNDPEFVSIRSGTLKHLAVDSMVGVAVRIKSESLVTLENRSERLALATPALKNAVIDVPSLSFDNPVRWAQPLSLERLCFEGVWALIDWQAKVVPLLRQCTELEYLEFVDKEVQAGVRSWPESDMLPLDVLVGHLPLGLKSLTVSHGLLQLLSVKKGSEVSHSRVQSFRMTSRFASVDLPRYKQLGAYFPNANKPHV